MKPRLRLLAYIVVLITVTVTFTTLLATICAAACFCGQPRGNRGLLGVALFFAVPVVLYCATASVLLRLAVRMGWMTTEEAESFPRHANCRWPKSWLEPLDDDEH